MRSIQSSRASMMAVSLVLTLVGSMAIAQVPSASPPKAEEKTKPKEKEKPKAATTRKAKPDLDAMPVVMSSEALAKSRGKSLDDDRYDGDVDWSRLPPWRQASFFGIRAEGQLFIYVVDCSGSMIDEDRLDRAKAELRRSVNGLQSPQRFKVIFYNDRPVPMPGELPRSADPSSKSRLSNWMHLIQPEGPTDPRSSLSLALALKPDAVFLLSDGAFPEGTVGSVAKLNPKKVPIHCVDLANGAAGDDLRRIAEESGGQYAARGH